MTGAGAWPALVPQLAIHEKATVDPPTRRRQRWLFNVGDSEKLDVAGDHVRADGAFTHQIRVVNHPIAPA